jgi:hypothetical protein
MRNIAGFLAIGVAVLSTGCCNNYRCSSTVKNNLYQVVVIDQLNKVDNKDK